MGILRFPHYLSYLLPNICCLYTYLSYYQRPTTSRKKLPIGIQSIQEIITEGYIYVDKTRFALELIKNGKHYFLARARRFGKSLFLSTLEEIFKGNKALFEGCHIAQSPPRAYLPAD